MKEDTVDFQTLIDKLKREDTGDIESVAAREKPEDGPMEYAIHDVCLALTWALVTRRRSLAKRLWGAIQAGDLNEWILLPPELGAAVDEADRTLAMFGERHNR